MFIGPPGAGKSTFYRRYFPTYRLISKDLMKKVRNRQARQLELLESCLARGESAVVDNTNPRIADRAPLIAAGKRFGAVIKGYYFVTTPDECLYRDSQRSGRERVPPVAIHVFFSRIEPPGNDEEFSELFVVTPIVEGFQVAAARCSVK